MAPLVVNAINKTSRNFINFGKLVYDRFNVKWLQFGRNLSLSLLRHLFHGSKKSLVLLPVKKNQKFFDARVRSLLASGQNTQKTQILRGEEEKASAAVTTTTTTRDRLDENLFRADEKSLLFVWLPIAGSVFNEIDTRASNLNTPMLRKKVWTTLTSTQRSFSS